jgi:hypothetical protein
MLQALSSARLLRDGPIQPGGQGTHAVCQLDRTTRSCASGDLIDDDQVRTISRGNPVPRRMQANGPPSFARVASETLAPIAKRYAANVTIISRFA